MILSPILSHLDDVKMNPGIPGPDDRSSGGSERQRWLGVLAHAPRAPLERFALGIPDDAFIVLRAPEVGMTMVRARIGNGGDRFNLGDATVTRCVVRHRGAGGRLVAGVGYVLGRDEARAEWVARLDAMLQQPEHHEALMREVIAPLAAAIASERARDAARTASSRVDFQTLAAENDA